MKKILYIFPIFFMLSFSGCVFTPIKPIEPVPIPPEMMDGDLFWQDFEDQFRPGFVDEEALDDLNFYSFELGRNDPDILSRRTYSFYLPADIHYELQGVDASSGLILFKKGDKTVFKMITYDYQRPQKDIVNFWPNAVEYSFVGGHTNILELGDMYFEEAMYIFADSLQIDGENVF